MVLPKPLNKLPQILSPIEAQPLLRCLAHLEAQSLPETLLQIGQKNINTLIRQMSLITPI